MPFRLPAAAVLIALALVLVAGCGGSDDDNSTAASSGGSTDSSGGAYQRPSGGDTSAKEGEPGEREEIAVANDANLGDYLVDEEGKALYMFEKDNGTESSCYDACADAWPPVVTDGEPKAEDGVDASKLSTTKRKDGSTQVVYNGFPLYYFAPDSKGTTEGQGSTGFGAPWWVLDPSGKPIETSGS